MPKISDLGNPLGRRLKRGEDLSWSDMYHQAKFHADQCHRRRDICNWTDLVSRHTNVWRVVIEVS